MKALVLSKAFVNGAYRRKLDELARLGIEVVAATPPSWREGGGEGRLERGESDAYDLRVLPIRFNGHFHLHYYPCFQQLVREVRPDVVHIDEEPYNVATFHAALAARREGVVSLFFTWQNLLRRYPPPFRDMERAVYRWSSFAIAGSEEASRVLRAKGYRGGLTVIPQFGVDPDQFSPEPKSPRPFTVGFFNRLIPGKAPLLSLAAFSKLPSDARLEIVGDGPLRPQVDAAVQSLHLQERVTVRSRVPSVEVPSAMRTLDVLILPSVTTSSWKEQFGRVLIEAMASGVPVIGTSSGEIPHVIGDAGLVVPEDDEVALAAAMQRLYEDAALRADLAQRGRQRVLERFTHARIAQRTVDAYREALRRR